MLKKFSFLFLIFSCVYSFNFSNVLKKSKLQCPTSKKAILKNCFQNFYIQNSKLIFYMCGKGKRSELRFKDNFTFRDKKILEATVRVFADTNEVTFLQIHTLKGINKPILRVALFKNHLKLFVFNGYRYIKKDLGRYNYKYVTFKIVVDKNYLKIFKNSQVVLNTKIYYDKKCYFKAGVYLQRPGCAKAEFKQIKEI